MSLSALVAAQDACRGGVTGGVAQFVHLLLHRDSQWCFWPFLQQGETADAGAGGRSAHLVSQASHEVFRIWRYPSAAAGLSAAGSAAAGLSAAIGLSQSWHCSCVETDASSERMCALHERKPVSTLAHCEELFTSHTLDTMLTHACLQIWLAAYPECMKFDKTWPYSSFAFLLLFSIFFVFSPVLDFDFECLHCID